QPKVATPVHRQLLKQLVALPTATGKNEDIGNALRFVSDYLRARGMHIEQLEHKGVQSLYASVRPGNTRPAVLLNAHIDTVPAEPGQLKLTEKDGKLYGRGVMDMKFAIASFMTLVDTLKDNLQSYDFALLITGDEEVGGENGAHASIKKLGL